jgi:hypothetical protein
LRTTLGQGLIESNNTVQRGSGFIEDCFYIENNQLSPNIDYSIKWDDSTSSKMWLNPTGLSGRGDVVFDQSGLILHWIEVVE